MDAIQPFVVNIGDLRCRFTPDPEAGGYTVRVLNRRGVISQGGTFEEAVAMIQDAAQVMREYRAGKQSANPSPAPARLSGGARAKSRRRAGSRPSALAKA